MYRKPCGRHPPWSRLRSRSPAPRQQASTQNDCSLFRNVGEPCQANAAESLASAAGLHEPSCDVAAVERVWETAKRLHDPHAPMTVHQTLGVQWVPTGQSMDGPSPRDNLRLLREHANSGANVGTVLDAVIQGRLGNVLAASTCTTYISHVRLVLQFCELAQASPLPAARTTVLRFIGLFNNARTLRGAQAAWRQIHVRCNEVWPLEGDPFYAMLHRAVCRSMACRPPKRALRMPQALKLILHACDKDGAQWLEVAAVIALGYVFGLRVPSELLRQSRAALWKLEAATVHYGPVKRKHRDRPVILARSCVCREAPVLCPRVWARYVVDHLPPARSFAMSGADFNRRFRILHAELGAETVQGWTSHAMRRGMALDVLERRGFRAMLKAGDWNSAGAFAYASKEDVEQRLVGEMFAHHSDDDT